MTKAGPPPAFDRFVGVDWSGAKRRGLPGLQVAVAEAGRSAPQLVPCPVPGRKHWTRSTFVDWLVSTLSENDRVLVGFDFAFSFPRSDRGGFFPGLPDSPDAAEDLWRCVDDVCEAAGDFYAGAFAEGGRYAPYFQGGGRYEPRLRATDERCHDIGLGRPESVFKLVGPKQVGKASLAGMRVLRHLHHRVPGFCIWPFDDPLSRSPSGVVAVEVYPGAFVRMLKAATKGKVRDMRTLDRVLKFYGSAPLRDRAAVEGRAAGDKADALIAAVALRHLSGDGTVWSPPGLPATEGWIFGVT